MILAKPCVTVTIRISYHSTVQPITPEQLRSDDFKAAMSTLDTTISNKRDNSPSDDSIYTYNLDNDTELDIPEHITPEYVPIKIENSIPEADN